MPMGPEHQSEQVSVNIGKTANDVNVILKCEWHCSLADTPFSNPDTVTLSAPRLVIGITQNGAKHH